MAFKSLLAKPFASLVYQSIRNGMQHAVADQDKWLKSLTAKAVHTQFGKDHHFDQIRDHASYQQAVPIRDYEDFKPYIERMLKGESNILWSGKPQYFAKTSGTTSGAKYIPLTHDSIPYHIKAARNALLCYIAETGNAAFADGQMIFLSGSPELETTNGIQSGRLSGIVNHHVPAYLHKNRLPSYATNCIEDWETKLDAIVQETMGRNMTLISGIPPWMQMYFDRLMEKTGQKVGDLFPEFSLLVHGGVNFEPYKARLFESIGRAIDTIETFPASEGFFAFQDSQQHEGLLLLTNAGMFYEFVPADEIFNEHPTRLTLGEVKTGVNYALIISSNAGLWAYNIGDTIRFVSLDPYRIVVTGRIKHFISAFGEHVIAEEVEHAMRLASEKFSVQTIEFTVAPYIASEAGQSYHEWFVEFEHEPNDLQAFALELDQQLRSKNIYYDDLIRGNILSKLKLTPLRKHAFIDYMKSIGKLGGQNKVPRLSNDRKIGDVLSGYRN
ncbi:MAG: GH3 auxin-responsive promoter family protein [Chitinophagaceae bacterium]|nr:GH3 auxin-responsive promoter family protein [Chitinophagaceae bacterium]